MKINQGKNIKQEEEAQNKHSIGDVPGRKTEIILVRIIGNQLCRSQKQKEPKGNAEVPGVVRTSYHSRVWRT